MKLSLAKAGDERAQGCQQGAIASGRGAISLSRTLGSELSGVTLKAMWACFDPVYCALYALLCLCVSAGVASLGWGVAELLRLVWRAL